MRKTAFSVTAFFAFSTCIFPAAAAVNIDVRGKIVTLEDDSVSLDSVPCASLFLKNHPEVRCTTDEHGSFRLTNTPSAVLRTAGAAGGREIRVIEKRNGLLISAAGTETKTGAGVYDASGRLIASSAFEDRTMGDCFIPLMNNARNIHFVKVRAGAAAMVFRTVPGGGASTAVHASQRESATGLGKRGTSPIVDTVVVYLRGYRTGLFGIGSYTAADITGKIGGSNFWKNCMGPLISKSGSMMEILAKDKDFEMGQFCDTIWGKKNNLPTSDLEAPMHTVSFSRNFFIDSTEITQGEYDSLMKATYAGYVKPAWNAEYGTGTDFPVYSVSWDDAVLFCNARSKRDHFDTVYSYSGITGSPGAQSILTNVSADLAKSGYRLPTEAEWEYACRGGKPDDFFWERNVDYYKQESGDDSYEEANTYAIWAKNSGDPGSGSTTRGCRPVTSMLPNGYNLYGMAGNVSEWCNDWFGKYQWGAATDPTGPTTGTSRVIRGGNWKSDIFSLRIANRYFTPPLGPINENVFKGFRTARRGQ
jgi:formylglycine-generating enzyme required for sulfatase activity